MIRHGFAIAAMSAPAEISLAGLTPRRNQSGERDLSSGITKVGDGERRKVWVQAATVMLHRSEKNCALKAWALRRATKRGQRRATIALARRMAVVLLRMGRDGTPFQYTRTVTSVSDPA